MRGRVEWKKKTTDDDKNTKLYYTYTACHLSCKNMHASLSYDVASRIERDGYRIYIVNFWRTHKINKRNSTPVI